MSTSPSHRPGQVEVRLYGGLEWFCSAADRNGTATVPAGAPRSVKDLVESLGVPHVEIGAVLVDGEAVDLGLLVTAGTRVAVYPPVHDLAPARSVWPEPPDPRRFVADVHLGTLARLLRLLGFDTWYAPDVDDQALAERAVGEERILLSRDRQLLMRRVIAHGYCPRSHDPDEQLDEVVTRYALAGRVRPFTRCAECNAAVRPVTKAEVIDLLPPRTRVEHDTFARCTGCGRVYWPGSHVDALSHRLGSLLDRAATGEP